MVSEIKEKTSSQIHPTYMVEARGRERKKTGVSGNSSFIIYCYGLLDSKSKV